MPTTGEVEFGLLSPASSDERRDLYEFNFRDSSLKRVHVHNAPNPLGQHYHQKKVGVFYFLEGGGIIKTALVNQNGEIVGMIRRFEVGPGDVIKIPPYHTHRFDLKPDTIYLDFSSTPFDPDNIRQCPIQ